MLTRVHVDQRVPVLANQGQPAFALICGSQALGKIMLGQELSRRIDYPFLHRDHLE